MKKLLTVAALLVGCSGPSSPAVGTSEEALDCGCQSVYVPVTVAGVSNAQIYGELCMPEGRPPATVQVLVHTTGANHKYWDPPADRYSYVKAANKRGYATFNLDRFGTGKSTTPDSSLVSITTVEDTIHQVIAKLRAGAIGSHAFRKVVWTGSSYGAAYGWVNATRHPGDVDGYVFTSIMHYTKPSFMANLALPAVVSVCADSVFSALGLDCNYISTALGSIGPVYFYEPYAAPDFLGTNGIYDTAIRDVVSFFLLGESLGVLGGITLTPNGPVFTPMPVDTDFARAVTVPSLVVIGDHDNIFCGAPDGLTCTPSAIQQFEAPYYGRTPDVLVTPNAGHVFALHKSGPAAFQNILNWVDTHVGSR